MARPILPTYSIQTLRETPVSHTEFVADHFRHYLEEHRNLHFPHKHSFYQLVYFSEGRGSHAIDFVRFPVEAGQLYVMIPGQVHSWDFDGDPDGYIVNFSEAYIQSLVANPRYLDQFSFFSGTASEQVIPIPSETRAIVTTIFETIVREAQSDQPLHDDFARAALVQLFISINRFGVPSPHPVTGNYNQVLLRNFQQLIEQYYKEKKLARDYAAMLYVTPNHLNALCKEATTRSAGELIRDRILLEAKRLLINARVSISDIAQELNFDDNSYFSKFFKRYEGVSPEIFRKQFIQTT